jgi:hypothetical protein
VRISNETPLLKTICWLDLPALIILDIASLSLLLVPRMTVQTLSWLSAVFLLIVTFVQWWLIGFFLERGFLFMRKKRSGSGGAIEQIVGRERRERVSHHQRCGDA